MTKLNRSIDRGLTVVEVIATMGTSSLAVLAAQTGLPKPTLLRICATLEARRWLFRRTSDGKYQLGSAFPRCGGMPNRVDRLVSVGKSEIIRLSRETGLASDLAAATADGRLEIVDTSRSYKLHSIYPDAVAFRPSPLMSALGAAYLFALSDQERAKALQGFAERLPREELNALPSVDRILAGIAERGYAVRAPGHWGRAVDYGALPTAIAVPIIAGDRPVGAVNLVWNSNEQCVEKVARDHLARLASVAQRIGSTYSDQS